MPVTVVYTAQGAASIETVLRWLEKARRSLPGFHEYIESAADAGLIELRGKGAIPAPPTAEIQLEFLCVNAVLRGQVPKMVDMLHKFEEAAFAGEFGSAALNVEVSLYETKGLPARSPKFNVVLPHLTGHTQVFLNRGTPLEVAARFHNLLRLFGTETSTNIENEQLHVQSDSGAFLITKNPSFGNAWAAEPPTQLTSADLAGALKRLDPAVAKPEVRLAIMFPYDAPQDNTRRIAAWRAFAALITTVSESWVSFNLSATSIAAVEEVRQFIKDGNPFSVEVGQFIWDDGEFATLGLRATKEGYNLQVFARVDNDSGQLLVEQSLGVTLVME